MRENKIENEKLNILSQLNHILELESFTNEDGNKIPKQYLEDMLNNIIACYALGLPQPEIVPHLDANGVQAEWENDRFYVEINLSSEDKITLFVEDKSKHLEQAFDFINTKDAFIYAMNWLEKM